MGNDLFDHVRMGIGSVGDFLERCLPLMPQAGHSVYDTEKKADGEPVDLPSPPSFENLSRYYKTLLEEIRKDRSSEWLLSQWESEKRRSDHAHAREIDRHDKYLEKLKTLRRKLESEDNTPLVRRALALTHAEVLRVSNLTRKPPEPFTPFEEWSTLHLNMARHSFDNEVSRLREEFERYLQTAEELVAMYEFASLRKGLAHQVAVVDPPQEANELKEGDK